MITCRECIESLKPDDPRVRSGRYGRCGCDYCNKPSYYRELEEEQPTEVTHRHINYNSSLDRKQWDRIEQAIHQIYYLDKKLNDHLDKRKKVYNRYT